MSSKNNTEVIIDGKIFTLSGYESEEYLQKVANYINNKIAELKKEESYRRQNIDVQKALLDLNIADDYFKAKKQADALEGELEDKDKQLYDVKHELISLQIKLDECMKEKEDVSSELSEAQKEIIRLETRIAERKDNEASEAPKSTRKSSSRSKSSSKSSKNRDNAANSQLNSDFTKAEDNSNTVSSSSDSTSYDSGFLSSNFSDSNDSKSSDTSFLNSSTTHPFEQMGLFDAPAEEKEADPSPISNEVDKILSSLGED